MCPPLTDGFDKVRQSLQKLADEEGVVTKLSAEVATILTEPLGEGPSQWGCYGGEGAGVRKPHSCVCVCFDG